MSQGIIFITLAFILYTVGVWTEKIQGELKRGHLLVFFLGVVCDVLGTSAMRGLSKEALDGHFHSVTGFIALGLMVLHACWATFILAKNKEEWMKKFHRYSFMVWIIWLIPFISGILFHIR